MLEKITQQQIKDAKENPIFENLSEELKNPEIFEEIEKKLANIMLSDHNHLKAKSPLKSFLNCKRCFSKMIKKRQEIEKLGFKNYEQYLKYKKIMQIIINKKDLILYAKD